MAAQTTSAIQHVPVGFDQHQQYMKMDCLIKDKLWFWFASISQF